MSKQKLILDMDETITQSVKAYYNTYKQLFQNHVSFKEYDYTTNNKWNLEDICPNLMGENQVEKIFSMPNFFDNLELFEDAEVVIKELCKKYDLWLCSLGTKRNLMLKSKFLEEKLPYIDNVILLSNNGVKCDKSIINMEGAIFIDDNLDNLLSSNASKKYVYGAFKPWNEKAIRYNIPRLSNWKSVERELFINNTK